MFTLEIRRYKARIKIICISLAGDDYYKHFRTILVYVSIYI